MIYLKDLNIKKIPKIQKDTECNEILKNIKTLNNISLYFIIFLNIFKYLRFEIFSY